MKDGAGLGDAYGVTLGRIQSQGEEKAKLAVTTLTWVCHSERPLKVDELCHALAVEIGAADFDSENIPSIDTLLDSVRNSLGARAAPRGNCQEDRTGLDDNFYSVQSWDILGLQG